MYGGVAVHIYGQRPVYIGQVEPYAIAPVVGAQLDPASVVGRDALIAKILDGLRAGNNFHCASPRRFGKTCVLDRLVHDPGDGFIALKIDYEGVPTAQQFLLRTASALRDHAPLWQRIKMSPIWRIFSVEGTVDVIPGAELKVAESQEHRSPQELLEALLAGVSKQLAEDDEVLIVAMDEVPLAVQNIVESGETGPAEAALLLQHLRNARKNARHIRWIVTGSVGFHHVLGRVRNGTEGMINDLADLPVGPLASDDAIFLAHCLALGIERTLAAAAESAVVYETDGIAYLVQALFHHINNHSGRTGPISAQEISSSASDYFENRDASRANDHFLNRIETYYPKGLHASAWAVLDSAAADLEAGTSIAEATETAMVAGVVAEEFLGLQNLLIDDHYLHQHAGRLRWRYPVLGRLWVLRRNIT